MPASTMRIATLAVNTTTRQFSVRWIVYRSCRIGFFPVVYYSTFFVCHRSVSYATAMLVSCTSAVGLGKMVDNAKRLSPSTRSFLGKVCILCFTMI